MSLLHKETQEQFATARITRVIEKPLGNLSEEDKEGHEVFASDSEMYGAYRKYYQKEVTSDTLVKIAWFELL